MKSGGLKSKSDCSCHPKHGVKKGVVPLSKDRRGSYQIETATEMNGNDNGWLSTGMSTEEEHHFQKRSKNLFETEQKPVKKHFFILK